MGSISVASIVLNAAIPTLALMTWLMLALGGGGNLAHRGVESLKYFTVLSNLFSAIVCTIYLVVGTQSALGVPDWLLALKLASASSVMLTFLTVVLILAPVYGWKSMYSGGNFWLHLVLPLLAAIDCCLCAKLGQLSAWWTLAAMVPTLLYGVFYLRNILVHGAKENGVTYDFYQFLRWGRKRIPVVMLAMLLASWGIGALLHVVSSALG